ncbi:MAG TPA: CvpA family protein [Candidatus Dormibacteraeota bacterium]|nr:CvpA family protein [Candidatus Dormibacteraeota bacterium]
MRVIVDVGAIILILLNVFLGWRYGLIRRGIAFAGLYGGVALASFAGNDIENFFRGHGKPDDLYAAATTYALCIFVLAAGLEVLGALYGDKVRDVISLFFDRIAGAIAGAFLGFLEIALICLVMLAVGDATQGNGAVLPNDHHKASNAVRDALIGSRVAGSEPVVRDIFAAALPSDLSAKLGEATK